MRNRFYKILAIIIAANMMSMTVFAAEDALGSAPAGDTESSQAQDAESGNSSQGSDEGGDNAGDQGGSSDEGGSGDQGGSSDEGGSGDQGGNSDQDSLVEQDANSGDQGGNSSDQGAGSGDQSGNTEQIPSQENQQSSSDSTMPGSGDAAENPSGTGSENADGGNSEAPTDEEIKNMLEETKRRTASGGSSSSDNENSSSSSDSSSSENDSSDQQPSWSNSGTITDVMGIKAVADGENVIISYKTKHTSDWDYNYQNNPITINYANGNGTNNNNTIIFDWNGFGIHGDNWSNIDGVTITKTTDQNDTEIVNITIPASWFESTDFTVSGGNYTTKINGTPVIEDHSNDAVYSGIALDGTFNDWDAVQKSTLVEPDGDHNVESCAWVIEKDYVYIYLKDDGSNSATWAGPNHNGKYAITTDLGRTLVFQLTEDGAIVGADGAIANHTGSQWEIAIPTSSLPQNNGGLAFGLYLSDSTLEGYGEVSDNKSTTDIEYDGKYGDWDNYPHQEIQYATAGTRENVPDGEAAVYVDNAVYGHCETRMQAHLDDLGSEFTQGVSIAVNDDWSKKLEMRLVTVDSAGNINWNPNKANLSNGEYEYYIFDVGCWGTSKNINDLVEADVCYGKATITIQEGRHDMEWYVDSNKLAARYGILESDMKTVSTKYIRIGDKVVTSAGASSGPWTGAGLCVLSALAPFVLKKKFIF